MAAKVKAIPPQRDGRTIIDAHAHVIEQLAGIGGRGEARAVGGGRVRWIGGEEAQVLPAGWGDRSFPCEKLLEIMDGHGVAQAVLMQGSGWGFCNEYTWESQQRYPDRLHGMGTFDPFAYEASRIMDLLVRRFGFRGFKFELTQRYGLTGFHPDLRLDGAVMDSVWECAEANALVVSLDLGTFGEPSLQVRELATVAARHPGVSFVVEHLFFPGPGHFDDVRKALGALAPRPNISVTVASIPASTAPEEYPYPAAARHVAIAREVMGASRILWGSDLPSTAVRATYAQLIDWVRDSAVFSSEELREVYAGNAARIYGS